MRKIRMYFLMAFVFGLFILHPVSGESFGGFYLSVQQHPYTGKFVLQAGQMTLTLNLVQHVNKRVTGTLKSSNGTLYQVKGMYEDGGVVTGTCSNSNESVFFEAYLEGNEMTFALYEPDANNQPNYDTEKDLVFRRASSGQNAGGVHVPVPAAAQSQQNVAPATDGGLQSRHAGGSANQNYASGQQSNAQGMGGQAAGNSNIGTNEVGDKSWGFKFTPTPGWVHKQSASAVLLGHNSIAGMIIVFPHQARSMQQMQQEMMQGIQEEGTSLRVAGNMASMNNNTLSCDYAGVVNGQQVKAKGYGVLSPYGGGAYILAIATPDKMSNGLTTAARQVAANMRYFKQNAGSSSGLLQFFADVWVSTTINTSSYVYLYADGTWSNRDESYYSGNFNDGGGNVTGNWGAGGQQNSRGKWSVRGNRDQGQLITISPNGERSVYEYHVHIENGHKYYSEYYFNGTLYHRKNKYDE